MYLNISLTVLKKLKKNFMIEALKMVTAGAETVIIKTVIR